MEKEESSQSRLHAMMMTFDSRIQGIIVGKKNPREQWYYMRGYMRSVRKSERIMVHPFVPYHALLYTEFYILKNAPIFSSSNEVKKWESLIRQLLDYPLYWSKSINKSLYKPDSSTLSIKEKEEQALRYISTRLESMMRGIDRLNSSEDAEFKGYYDNILISLAHGQIWLEDWENRGGYGNRYHFVDQRFYSIIRDICKTVSVQRKPMREHALDVIWKSWIIAYNKKEKSEAVTKHNLLEHLKTSKDFYPIYKKVIQFIGEIIKQMRQLRSVYGMNEMQELEGLIDRLTKIFLRTLFILRRTHDNAKITADKELVNYAIKKMESCLE